MTYEPRPGSDARSSEAVRPRPIVRAAVTSIAAMTMLASTGCSMLGFGKRTGGPGVVTPVSPIDDTASAQPEPTALATSDKPAAKNTTRLAGRASAADLLFSDTEPGEPEKPAGDVNVFGELDGVGPSVYTPGGKGGFIQHTYVDEGYDADVRVSPDGKSLIFTSTRHSEHPDIYTQRVDGLAVTQITTDPADDAFPCFSPDGKRVAFASNRTGNWDIYVMDLDGTDVEQITRSPAQEIHPSFSPDGTRLAFCASALARASGRFGSLI
ncbi:MAG: DPP IV N-terminal domain-containing protein [Tepidisphaeraceae bacterium]